MENAKFCLFAVQKYAYTDEGGWEGEAQKHENIYYVIYEWSPNERGGTGA